MPHLSLTRDDYVKVAEEKDLTFEDKHPPVSVYDKANWRCNFCGKMHSKSYRAVKYGKSGCRCRANNTLTESHYRDLAQSLNLVWLARFRPTNSKTPTEWKSNKTGYTFRASYHDLSYGQISKDLQVLIG